jgi:hypothetical protein
VEEEENVICIMSRTLKLMKQGILIKSDKNTRRYVNEVDFWVCVVVLFSLIFSGLPFLKKISSPGVRF